MSRIRFTALFDLLAGNRRGDSESGSCQKVKSPLPGTTCLLFVFLLVAVSLMFVFSIPPRAGWFGTFSLPPNRFTSEALTALALRMVGEWLRAPALLNLSFPTYLSAEFTFEGGRFTDLMTCYFPLFFMPLYIPAKLFGVQPSVSWAMFYGLLAHWTLALLGAGLVFTSVLSATKRLLPALLLSLASAGVLIFHPAPMYFFQATYWADIFVIPLFAALVLLESLRDTALAEGRSALRLDRLIAATVFTSFLVDWFTISVVAAITIKRLCFWQWGGNWKAISKGLLVFSVPVFLAAIPFSLNLIVIYGGAWGLLVPILKFLLHSGASDSGRTWDNFVTTFWGGHFQRYYGFPAQAVLWLTLAVSSAGVVAFALMGRRQRTIMPGPQMRLVGTSFILVMSCFLHTYLLHDHAAEVDYTALKFVLPLSCASFALLPTVLAMMTRHWRSSIVLPVGAAAVLAATAMVMAADKDSYSKFSWRGTREYERVGLIITENVHANDLVIGPRLFKGSKPEDYMCEMTILSASAGRAVLMRHDQLAQVESLTGKPVDTVVYVAPEPLTGEESTLKQRATDQWSGGGGLQFMRLPVSALSQSDGSPNP